MQVDVQVYKVQALPLLKQLLLGSKCCKQLWWNFYVNSIGMVYYGALNQLLQ
jgi:hypothetical protein